MKTPGQRGPFGRWLTAARTQRYETQAEALRAFERLGKFHITPSEYAQWESGSRVPRPDNPKVARLYEFFGSRPEDEPEEPASVTGDLAELIAAQDRTTAAIERQTEMLRSVLALLGQRSVDPAVAGPLERWGHALAASWPQFQEPVPTLTESERE